MNPISHGQRPLSDSLNDVQTNYINYVVSKGLFQNRLRRNHKQHKSLLQKDNQ